MNCEHTSTKLFQYKWLFKVFSIIIFSKKILLVYWQLTPVHIDDILYTIRISAVLWHFTLGLRWFVIHETQQRNNIIRDVIKYRRVECTLQTHILSGTEENVCFFMQWTLHKLSKVTKTCLWSSFNISFSFFFVLFRSFIIFYLTYD